MALLVATPAAAAPVSGRLGTGRAGAPALRVYAWSKSTAHLYSVASGTALSYTLDLPPGRYWLFAGLDGPDAPPIYAAYTDSTRCLHQSPPAQACDGHALAEIEVGRRALSRIDLTDWALDDAAASAIDGVLGRAPGDPYDESSRAAPKFTEYPARAAGEPLTAAAAPTGYRDADRELLAAARLLPASFAGRLQLVPVACGAGCSGVALYDLKSGQVRYPAALNPLPEPPPCELRALLQYRRDSRLLIVREAGGAAAATLVRYYTVDPDALELKLVTSRTGPADSGERHCASGEAAHVER